MEIAQQLVIFIGVAISLFAVTRPRLFLTIAGLVLISPYLIMIKLFLFAFQKIYNHTVAHGKQELRLTIWHRVMLRLNYWLWTLVEEAADTFNKFVREEMIEVGNQNNEVVYTPVDQRDKDPSERSTFTMRKLSKSHLAEIKDRMLRLSNTGQIAGVNNQSVRLATTREMLDGWTNIVRVNEDGSRTTVKFDAKKRKAMYELLPDEITDELQERFGDGSLDWEAAEARLEEAEEKQEEFLQDLDDLGDEESKEEVEEAAAE